MVATRLAVALVAGVVILSTAGLSSQQDRVPDILARAREAIGGEGRLRNVQSLSLEAKALRRSAPRMRVTADSAVPLAWSQEEYRVTVEIVLPDRFVVRRNPGGAMETEDGVNGSQLIAKARGETRRVIGPNAAERFAELQQREFLRFMLACLLVAPDQYGVRFSDGGPATVDGTPAHFIEATGGANLAVRMFFDKQGRLLALRDRERGAAPRATPQPAAPENQAAKDVPVFRSLEGGPPPGPPMGVYQVRGGDYRPVAGISFPHLIVIDRNDYDHSEWRVSRVRVNPKIDLKHFDPK
jgi:hypothetical protein